MSSSRLFTVGNDFAGLKFTYKSKSCLNFTITSIADSPTGALIQAFVVFILSIASSDNAIPLFFNAESPASISNNSNSIFSLSSNDFITSILHFMISGPIPSPDMTDILYFILIVVKLLIIYLILLLFDR